MKNLIGLDCFMERKYTAIILSKKDIGEADRLYTAYTLEAGKIQAVAQGVKKPRAKLAGQMENFTLADLTVAKRKGTGRITGSIAENNFCHIRNDFEALSGVFESLRILNRLTVFENKDGDVFNLAAAYLRAMDKIAGKEGLPDKKAKIDLLTVGFIFKLLDALGYKIEANFCVECGNKLSDRENYFSLNQGGILCGNCSSKEKNLLKISNNAIKIIRIFFQNGIESVVKVKAEKSDVNNLKIIAGEFIKWIEK